MNDRHLMYLLPTDLWEETVAYWEMALGVSPRINDGSKWAEFSVAGSRIALAGDDDAVESQCVGIRIEESYDLASVIPEGGLGGELSEGSHERRMTCRDPAGNLVIFFQPITR